jgi:hypothetical protein
MVSLYALLPVWFAMWVSAQMAWAEEGWVDSYPWLAEMQVPDTLVSLEEAFAPPAGFERQGLEPGSYAAWLRGLPLRADRVDVLSYRGVALNRPSAGVVAIDVGKRDLMQCADSAIRLHAEWLWASGRAGEAAYHFTSGDRSSWSDWQAGERFRISGSKVERVRGSARTDAHVTYRKWLDLVFSYAGTRSLRRDTEQVPADAPLQAGDTFVLAGSPGHAVILLDIAAHTDGRRAALVGQGFMPAEDIHVLTTAKPGVTLDGFWFLLGGPLDTPSWDPFPRDSALRFAQ